MEIKIDTELMQQMANVSLRAMNAMEEAIKAANTITLHDDWNCVERVYIDESVQNIKKNNNKINESMIDFSAKLNELAEKFNEFDQSLLENFSDFDSSVGELICISPLEQSNLTRLIGDNTSAWDNAHKQLMKKIADYQSIYCLKTFGKQISVVNFSDAQQIIEG